MERIVANISGKTRIDFLQGRKHIVANVVMIVPGVLNGSRGPLYYPPEEVTANVSRWNNIPLLKDHPYTPDSAKTPSILNSQGIGVVLNAYVEGEKLKAEAWFDIERTKNVDERIYSKLQKNEPFELSTGLEGDEDEKSGTTQNGKDYRAIYRNYRPDHLAVFVDKTGACSLEDGCGVLVNVTTNKESEMDKTKLVEQIIENCSCWSADEKDILMNFDQSKLEALAKETAKTKRNELIANAATSGVKLGKTTLVINEEGKWEGEDEIQTALTANEGMDMSKFSDDDLKEELKNRAAKNKDLKKTENEGDPPVNEPITPTTENRGQRMTSEEVETLQWAENERKKRRRELISGLVENVSDETEKKSLVETYNAMALDQLELLHRNRPKTTTNEEEFEYVDDYSGNGAFGPDDISLNEGTVAPEPVPVNNWIPEDSLN